MNVLDLCIALANNQLGLSKIYIDVAGEEVEIERAENRPGVYGLVLIAADDLELKPAPSSIDVACSIHEDLIAAINAYEEDEGAPLLLAKWVELAIRARDVIAGRLPE